MCAFDLLPVLQVVPQQDVGVEQEPDSRTLLRQGSLGVSRPVLQDRKLNSNQMPDLVRSSFLQRDANAVSASSITLICGTRCVRTRPRTPRADVESPLPPSFSSASRSPGARRSSLSVFLRSKEAQLFRGGVAT
eukprot:619399-Rhodomonas_salina.3